MLPDIKISAKYFALFALVWGIMLIGLEGKLLLLFCFTFYSFLGINQAIKALTISFMVFLGNSDIFPDDSATLSLLRITLLFCSSLSIWSRVLWKRRKSPLITGLLLTVSVLAITSCFSSYFLAVSIFKLALFTAGSSGIVAGFSESSKSKDYWIGWFCTLCTSVVLLSIPTIFITSIGFGVNGTGFQGITNQPQAFGIFLAPFAALLFANIVFEKKGGVTIVSLLVICTIQIFMTGARTAIISVALGFLFSVLTTAWRSGYWSKIYFRPLNNTIFILSTFALLLVVAGNWNSVSDAFVEFVFKRTQGKSLNESFEASRGFLIFLQFENIRTHPWIGIGFQLASLPELLEVVKDPIFGLPVQASIEKGNSFIALVEECGIIGGLAVSAFFIIYFKRLIKSKSLALLWFSFTAFFTNIGEGTLFSFGGVGLFIWLLLGLSVNRR